MHALSIDRERVFFILKEIVMSKKIKPYEKTEAAYKEILESKKKAYDQKNAVLRKQRLEKARKKTKN